MIEVYQPRLVGDIALEYDPEKVLPPDIASEVLAEDAFKLAQWGRYLMQAADRPTRLLIPGIGTGVLACSYLARAGEAAGMPYADSPTRIDAFDISDDALDVAAVNIARYQALVSGVEVNLYRADWSKRSDWEQFPVRAYDIVMVNPPYLPSEVEVPGMYAKAPAHTLYSGSDGLDAYRQMLPYLTKRLAGRVGSALAGRYSSSSRTQSEELEALVVGEFDYAYDDFSLRMLPNEGVSMVDDKWMSYFLLQYGAPLRSYRHYRVDGVVGLARDTLEFHDIFAGKVIPEDIAVDLANADPFKKWGADGRRAFVLSRLAAQPKPLI